MKVGVEAYTLSVPRAGIGRYLADLLVAAARPGVELTALLFPEADGPPRTDDLEAAGIRLRRPGRLALRGYLKALKLGASPPFQWIAGRHDVFLFTNYRRYPTAGRPCLSFVYDLGFQVVPECVDPGFLDELRRHVPQLVESSDRIGVISDCMARELAAAFPGSEEKLVVLPPAVTAQMTGGAPPDWRARLAARGLDPGYLLHVGTLEPRKNLVRLVEAATRLPDARLVLAGAVGWSAGPILAAIEAAGERVRHLADVSSDELRALYRGAALLVFPSRYEGFGMPVLEAMAAGVPVLCNEIPVLREAGGDAACYADASDPDALAGAIAALLDDPARRATMIERGRVQAAGFSWQASADRLAGALAELVR